MDGSKILFPYNYTPFDEKALEFVVQTFLETEATVTLLNTYIPVPDIRMKGAPVMERISGNLHHLGQMMMKQEKGLEEARRLLLEKGFAGERVESLFLPRKRDVATEIIAVAVNGKFDIVVINNKPQKMKQFFTGAVFNRVVTGLKDKTICIVT